MNPKRHSFPLRKNEHAPDAAALPAVRLAAALFLGICLLLSPGLSAAGQFPCARYLTTSDALLVADPSGRIIFTRNGTKKCTPASTLKILTSLVALEHLGPHYRYRTEFFLDRAQNLTVKGYGDPLLISEVWREIADSLADTIPAFGDLILDDTYFSKGIEIPGAGHSTNPYDAPVVAPPLISIRFFLTATHREGSSRRSHTHRWSLLHATRSVP